MGGQGLKGEGKKERGRGDENREEMGQRRG